MNTYELVITVNRPDDTELELEAACHMDLKRVGEAVDFTLTANGIKEGDWTSLVVVVASTEAPKRRERPKLTIVRGDAA